MSSSLSFPQHPSLPERASRLGNVRAALLLSCLGLVGSACRNEMYDQAKAKPLSEGEFFANGQNARPLPPDTVARGFLREDTARYTGIGPDGSFIRDLPLPLTAEFLNRGEQRFNIFCTPCHGKQGNGLGMIVERGFKRPPSFHADRLRQQPIGYFFDVMTKGFGVMSSYAVQVPPDDRWAIAAYVRALQLSQNAMVAELSPEDRAKVAAPPPKKAAESHPESGESK